MYKGLADFLFPQRKRNPKKKIQEPLVQPNQPYYFLKDKRKHKKIIKFLEEQNLMLLETTLELRVLCLSQGNLQKIPTKNMVAQKNKTNSSTNHSNSKHKNCR
jgi:hypothetical protein